MKYNSIFVSDLHLGTQNSSIDSFLNFIKVNEFKAIYLVGDIIDLIALKNKKRWSNKENLVIQKLLRLSRKGIRIHYVPGNHDSYFHEHNGESLGNIHIDSQVITIINNQNVLIIHGDEFDGVLKGATFLYSFGEFLYDFVIALNPLFNKLMKFLHISSSFSLSFALKHTVKDVIKFLSNYEKLMVEKAKANDCKVVICGHSHFPEQKIIDAILYLNCGCWTFDSLGSAVVEHLNGKLELIKNIQ